MDTHDLAVARRCRAHNSAGNSCAAWAVRGAVVCVKHGGAAPQVKRAARERLQALVDPAITRLEILIQDESPGVALQAVKDVLDRAGYKAVERTESTVLNAFTLRIDRGIDDDSA